MDRIVGAGLTAARVYDVVDAVDALYSYAIRSAIVGFSPVVWFALPGTQDPCGSHVQRTEASAADGYPAGAFEPLPTRDSAAQPAGGAALSAP